MILDSKVPCVALAIAFATSSLLGAQDQNSKVRNEYAALVKAAEERLKNSISKAQSRYLADIKRAQQHLDARLNHPKNKFEEYVTVLGAEPGAIQRGHDKQGYRHQT